MTTIGELNELVDLGMAVEQRWRASDFDESVLPDLAETLLVEHNIGASLSAGDILAWALSAMRLPEQRDQSSTFGQPPITLFQTDLFAIEIYFWFESTTAVHQHGFCGAFQVLHGSSLHTQFDFAEDRRISSFLQMGDLTTRSCNVLRVGDTQQIVSGASYIHSLFHLDEPSATLLIRTTQSKLDLPQLSYEPPGIAFDPFHFGRTRVFQTRVLEALARFDLEGTDARISAYLERLDFQSSLDALTALARIFDLGPEPDGSNNSTRTLRYLSFVEQVEAQHDSSVFSAVLRERKRSNSLVLLRTLVTDPQQRFLLALVMNLGDDTARIFDMVRTHVPDVDPIDHVVDLLAAMGNTRKLASDRATVLGTDDFDILDEFVLEAAIRSSDGAELQQRVAVDFAEQEGDELEARIETSLARLRQSPAAQPFLAHLPAE